MTSEEFRSNPLFLRNQFKSDGSFDMPIIQKQDIDLTNVSLIGYDQTKNGDTTNSNSFIHFFLDDYKFEVIWKDPEPRLEKLSQYKGILSPQFSTYYTMPITLQIYNTFRSRWCGAYFQSKGFNVIPTISWGLPKSYLYCFDGVEEGSIVAVSTLGVKREKDFFMQGYNEMLRRINPKAIICYCEPFDEMQGNIITIDYAETNNLTKKKTFYGYLYNSSYEKKTEEPEMPQVTKSYYVLKRCGYVVTAGMGSGIVTVGLYQLHTGKQGKHMPGHNNYIEGRSIMYDDMNTIQGLLNKYAGKGQKIDANKERVDFKQVIGRYINLERNISEETTMGVIHYSKDGAHIVPAVPKGE